MTNRRKFIKNSAALTALSLIPTSTLFADHFSAPKSSVELPKIFPKRLKKGDLIGLVTPGGTITEEQLYETKNKLEEFGFETYYNDSVLAQYGYFAGTDKERADELMHMFTNDNVDAILAVRGGYGAIRILDMLDYSIIQNNPKILIGYSDITALLTAIYERTGLITFHGPVGVSTFNDFTFKSVEKVLINPGNRYKYPYDRDNDTALNPEYDIYTITGGKAEGQLIGGNLSVLESMIGSAYEPDFEKKIVYLEEIEEKTYRIDKMLFHLLSSTNLKKAAGIILGVFDGCNTSSEGPAFTLKQAVTDLLKPLRIPISYGLPFGHIESKITIPNGIKARLNADKNTLKLLEKAVV
ncbi:MAG: LD-carboxypeptidase [Bacteroidota bacterium]